MEITGYEDLEEIGRGGYAVVYRAHESAFGRIVAIKVLTTTTVGETDRARFEREVLAMGRLSWHPSIVVVHATGVTGTGLPYLVEEYLEGGSLGDRLRTGGALDPAEAVDHVVRLCAAVHTAHEADLLHRDVKPDNALLDAFGRVKLADFGIAAVTGSKLTATGMVTATFAHAAPEVMNGERATFAADVYSLGSTLFELLAGAPAFVRATDESIVPLVVRTSTEPVPDLRARGVPDPIARVVEWAMAKDPADRPPSALALGQALQGAQQALGWPVSDLPVRGGPARPPTPAPPTGGMPRADATTTEHPADAGLAAASATVAAPVGAPAAAPFPGPSDPGPSRRSALPVVLVGLLVVAVGVGAYMVVSGGDDESGGSAGRESFDTLPSDGAGPGTEVIPVGARPFRVAAADDAVWVTNSEAASVSRIDPATDEVVATVDVGGEPSGVAVNADAAWVADFEDGTVLRIDPATDRITATIGVGDGPRNVAATDTAVWVTSIDDDSVSRIDPATDRVTATIGVGAEPRGIVVTDTAVWVTNSEDGTVTRIDPASGRVVATVRVGGFPSGVVSTEGAVWVTDSDADTVVRIDPVTNEVVGTVEVGADPGGMAATATAVYVAASGDDIIVRIDPATAEVTDRYEVGDAPGGLAVTGTDLWAANTEDDTVSRIALG